MHKRSMNTIWWHMCKVLFVEKAIAFADGNMVFSMKIERRVDNMIAHFFDLPLSNLSPLCFHTDAIVSVNRHITCTMHFPIPLKFHTRIVNFARNAHIIVPKIKLN